MHIRNIFSHTVLLSKIVLMLLVFVIAAHAEDNGKWNGYWEIEPRWAAEPKPVRESGFFASSALVWIRIYQEGISSQDLPSCVFHPSCSRFAFGCIERYGVPRGILMAGDRLLRCNPFVRKYYDFDGEKYVDPVERYDFILISRTGGKEYQIQRENESDEK